MTAGCVNFHECFLERVTDVIGEVEVPIISLARVRQNKHASGRDKDLTDLRRLPET